MEYDFLIVRLAFEAVWVLVNTCQMPVEALDPIEMALVGLNICIMENFVFWLASSPNSLLMVPNLFCSDIRGVCCI